MGQEKVVFMNLVTTAVPLYGVESSLPAFNGVSKFHCHYHYGLKSGQVKIRFLLFGFYYKISVKYELESDPNACIEELCLGILSGTLSPYYKSHPIPDNASV
ncbi:hypothetical protein LguiA_016522 [Lonicera macranthoides]